MEKTQFFQLNLERFNLRFVAYDKFLSHVKHNFEGVKLSIMAKSIATKMGIKADMRTIFINAPADAIEAIELPTLDVKEKLMGDFDYIHFFAYNQAAMQERFPKLKEHLNSNGMLWISWPKGGQNGTDLTIKSVIKIGYDYGLVESTCLSINSVWSAIKFTHPKKGKTYRNSYGKLPE